MEVQSLQSIVEQTSPKKEASKIEKIKGFFKKQERLMPSDESLAKVDQVDKSKNNPDIASLEKRTVFSAIEPRAEEDKKKSGEISVAEQASEAARARLGEIRAQEKAMDKGIDSIVAKKKGGADFQMPEEDIYAAKRSEVGKYQKAEAEKAKLVAERNDLRGGLPNESWEKDKKIAEGVAQSEKRAFALELDLAKGMAGLDAIDSASVSAESNAKLQQMSVEMRALAVSAAAEIDATSQGVVSLSERMKLRYPDYTRMLDSSRNAYLNKKEKATRATPNVEFVITEEITQREAGKMLAELSGMGVTDRTVIGKAMLAAGFEVDVEKSGAQEVWKQSSEKQSSAMLKASAEAQYAHSMEQAKKDIAKAENNPDRAMAAYIELNKAIASGSAAVTAENNLEAIRITAAKEQMKINLAEKAKTDAAAQKAVEAIAATNIKGIGERIAGAKKEAWGWLKKIATERESANDTREKAEIKKRDDERTALDSTLTQLREEAKRTQKRIDELNARLNKQGNP